MDNCPHCDAKIFKHPTTEYCIECGKKLKLNICLDSDCIINKGTIELPSNAIYCSACGGETTNSDQPF